MNHHPTNSAFLLFILLLFSGPTGCTTPNSHIPFSAPNANGPVIVWPSSPQPPRIKYIGSISTFSAPAKKPSRFSRFMDAVFGEEKMEGTMLKPYGVFADTERIYVTDTGLHLLHIFDQRKKMYFQIKKALDEPLVSPIGVTVDGNGDIYLTDSVLRKVYIYNKDGIYIGTIGSPEIFFRPAGIAVDEERVYVVDTHGHKVMVFSKKQRSLLFDFGKKGGQKGDFNYPTNIFLGSDGLIYVSDSLNFRVQIFDKDGRVISSFGKAGDGSGDFSKPKGIAVDSEGHIYIADAHFDNIQIFDREGSLLLFFGSTGRGPGELVLPAGIFIDEKDRIYVADSFNQRIQIFQYLSKKSN